MELIFTMIKQGEIITQYSIDTLQLGLKFFESVKYIYITVIIDL